MNHNLLHLSIPEEDVSSQFFIINFPEIFIALTGCQLISAAFQLTYNCFEVLLLENISLYINYLDMKKYMLLVVYNILFVR